ncbi:MAG TPA: inorganic diphosphatase [Gemmatimonadales bacterium]|jgi:inorganic pyrophosphatase|nr:inorganic diphosphatase [Gemmatimonadales bacterium]
MHHDILAIPPYDRKEKAWRVIIETAKGSAAKYSYEPTLGLFQLRHILPEGSVFPYAFGFIPSTLGDDGDPLDVLLLIEETTEYGAVILSRIIGVIEGEQKEKGEKPERNDRFLAVPVASRRFADIDSAKQLPRKQIKDICAFFEDYNDELGRTFTVTRWTGPAPADKLVKKGMRKFKAHRNRR